MMMIISRKNIRFDKMLSCCSGENSPWKTNKREDNTRPRSSRRGFFPLLVQRKLLFFFGDTFDALARECAVRVYAGESIVSELEARQWKPWEYSSRRGRTMERRVSPSPTLLNHFHGRNKGLLPPTSVSYTYSAPFVAFLCRNVAEGGKEREEHPLLPLS